MTLTELKARNPSWATMPDEKIMARAKERGVPIDPEPPSTSSGAAVPANGNGSASASPAAIPAPAAAGADVLLKRDAHPSAWETFAKKWGMTGEDLKNYAQSAATGIAKTAINASDVLGGPAKLVDVGVKYLTGSTPQEYVQSGAAALGMPFHEARPGTADPYFETAGSFLPMAVGGPAMGATRIGSGAAKLLSAAAGGVGSEAAGQAARPFGPTAETAARILGGAGAGSAALVRAPVRAATKAAQNVVEGLRPQYPTASEAITRARELGPAAAVYNIGEAPIGQMSTLAASPTAAGTRARQLLEQQVRGAQPRVEAGLDQVFGPGQTAYRQQVEEQLKRQGQKSVYQMGRGKAFDTAPVSNLLTQQFDAFPQAGSANRALRRVNQMLVDKRTGSFIDDTNNALGVRSEIDNLITQAGGVKGYEAGLRTPTGAALTPIRQAINDGLPSEVRQSDQVLSTSHRVEEAGRIGREEVLGGGAKMDPEQLAHYGPTGAASPAEKAAVLAGARQQAAHRLGELQAQAGIGKATTNALASQNVLERVRAIAGPRAAQQLEQLAMRENVIGGVAGQTAHGSATARRLLGAKSVPIPGERMMTGGGTTGAIIGQAVGQGLTTGATAGAFAAVNSGIKAIVNAGMRRRDTAVSSAMADILTATGGDRDIALQRLYALRPHLPHTSKVLPAVNALINGLLVPPPSTQPPGLLQ